MGCPDGYTARTLSSARPLNRTGSHANSREFCPVPALNGATYENARTAFLYAPTHTFELLDKRSDLLEDALLLGQVLRVQRAHLG